MTHNSASAVTSGLSASFDLNGVFLPTDWFYATFSVLPHREIYQLGAIEARQIVLKALAENLEIEPKTIVHSTYIAEAEKEPELQFQVVC